LSIGGKTHYLTSWFSTCYVHSAANIIIGEKTIKLQQWRREESSSLLDSQLSLTTVLLVAAAAAAALWQLTPLFSSLCLGLFRG